MLVIEYCPSYHSLAMIPVPTSRDLMNRVKTDQPIKLGRQLCVAESDLDIVEKDHPNDHDKQLSKVLSLYMKQSVKPSWEEVTTALWDIGEKRIAQQIADEYGMAISMCSSMHQISYMNTISACHHATLQSNVLLLSPIYCMWLYKPPQLRFVSTLSPTSTPGFPLPVQPTPGPSSSLHAPTSGKLPSHSYLPAGRQAVQIIVYFNIWPTALSLFQL